MVERGIKGMIRRFGVALASLMLIIPVGAWGLGLGDIKLHSALNQKFDAEIDLLSINQRTVETLSVRLASYDDFARVGVERAASLVHLRFDLEQNEDGSYIIKTTSTKPIREPFLNFIVDVSWASGRLLREYTVLLDPPGISSIKAQQVGEAPLVSSPTAAPPDSAPTATPPASTSTAVPLISAPTGTPTLSSPSAAASPSVSSSTGSPADPAAPVTAEAVAQVDPSAGGAVVYGPVRRNETLWKISEGMSPSRGATIYQMMMALYATNPDAFIDGNIHLLKQGAILRIDNPAQITSLSRGGAADAFARHSRRWADYKQQAARRAQRSVGGEAPVGAASAAADAEARLKLLAPQGEAASGGGTTQSGADAGGSVEQQMMIALESSEALRRENEELMGRLEKMETQLETMERLLSLKNNDLATMQQQLKTQQGQGAGEPPPVVEEPDAAEEEELPLAAAAEAQPGGTAEADTGAAPETAGQSEAEQPAAVQPQPQPQPAKVTPPPPPPPPEPTLTETVMALALDNLYILIGLLALIGGGIGAFVFMRKRNAGESSGGAGALMGGRVGALSSTGRAASAQGAGVSEVLAAADEHIASGNYQEAEGLLNEMLDRAPDHLGLIGKLLAVYHATGNGNAFGALASSYQAELQASTEVDWEKIMVMGVEVCPGNALFSDLDELAGRVEQFSGTDSDLDDDILDIGLDLDELDAGIEAALGGGGDEGAGATDPLTAETGEMDLGLDLDLGEAGGADDTPALDEMTTPAEDTGDDLDLDSMLADLGGDEGNDAGGLDLDTDMAGMGMETEDEPGGLDFDMASTGADGDAGMDDLDETLRSLGGELGLDDNDEGETEFSLGDLEGVLGEGDEASTSGSGGALAGADDGLGDLGDSGMGDDVDTKFDLARAYIDSDYHEGARSMLEEIIAEGNADQKKQAQDLLQQVQ